jgi:hypothetical protein
VRTLLPSLLLPLLAACNTAADRMLGSWVFDKATYELIPRYRALPPDEQRHWVDMARMDLTLNGKEITWEQDLPSWGSRSAKGAYTVAETHGNRVTIDANFGGRKERLVFTVEEDRLRFGLSGRSIILKRKPPKPGS